MGNGDAEPWYRNADIRELKIRNRRSFAELSLVLYLNSSARSIGKVESI
jgi:hypothetical protein